MTAIVRHRGVTRAQLVALEGANGILARQIYSITDEGGRLAVGLAANDFTAFAFQDHLHAIGDVTGLQAALDGKQAAGSYALQATSIIAGNGLSGGGNLAASRTLTLGTPGTLSGSTTNSVTATSHTHALSANLTAWDAITPASKANVATTVAGYGITNAALNTYSVVAGNGLTGGGALSASRTLTLGTPSSIGAATTNSVTTTSHTHALDDLPISKITGLQSELDTLAANSGGMTLLGELTSFTSYAEFTNIPEGFDELVLKFHRISHNDSSSRTFTLQLQSGAGSWATGNLTGSNAVANNLNLGGEVRMTNVNNPGSGLVYCVAGFGDATNGQAWLDAFGVNPGGPVTALRLGFSAGSLDGVGEWVQLWGVK